MLKGVRRMIHLWEKNKPWFKTQKPCFPTVFQRNVLTSFARFKERILRYKIERVKLESMSREERDTIFKTFFPGRKVKHYDSRMHEGGVILEESSRLIPKADFHTGNFVDSPYYKALLIKPSSTAILIAIAPFPVGFQPQKISVADSRFYNFLTEHPEYMENYDPIYHDRVDVSGAWPTQYLDFQKGCDPVQHESTYEDYIQAIFMRGVKLSLPRLATPYADDIDTLATKKKAQAGLLTGKLFGHNHERADKFIKPIAKDLWKKTLRNVCCDVSVWTIGGRSRKQKVTASKPLRSRCLLIPEGPNKIMALNYATPMYKAFTSMNFYNPTAELRVGCSDFHGAYSGFNERWESMAQIFEADLSTHDQNCAEMPMVVAFGLLRSMFDLQDKGIDNHFLFFMSGFIYKNVVTPGKFIYRLLKMLPTGSPFTSVVVSLVNWLNWSGMLSKQYPGLSHGFKLAIQGDDTLIGIPDSLVNRFTAQEYADKMLAFSGQVCDPAIFKDWYADKLEDRPSFLKTVSNCGAPCRLIKDTILSTLFVKKSNRSNLAYARFLTGLCYASPWNGVGLKFLLDYRRYVYGLCDAGGDYVLKQLLERVRDGVEDELIMRQISNAYFMPIILGMDKVMLPDYMTEVNKVINAPSDIPIDQYSDQKWWIREDTRGARQARSTYAYKP